MKKISDKTLPDTGERMIPAHHKGGMVYGEHIVRYQAAVDLVKDKIVLDIASGSGYGSALLGTSAKKVIGVDVDGPAVKYATKNYGTKNVSFKVGDGVKIPLEDHSVEVVVSFETIEHIEKYEVFMDEVKRVLKPDGLFILSTPNDIEFIEGNHFHIHEFEAKELEDLVAKYFKHTKSYFQATWLYNALIDEKLLGTEWRQPIDTMNTAPIGPEKAIYFFMLCSAKEIKQSVVPLGAISEHFSQRQISQKAEADQKYLHELEAKVHAQEALVNQKEAELGHVRQELKNITSSKAWKVADSLRRAKHIIKR